MLGWKLREAAGLRCSTPTTRFYPDRLARMIRRAESRGARIAVDNLDVVKEAKGETKPCSRVASRKTA